MSPTIPSPTPITGVKIEGGKPSLRLPIDVFQDQDPFAFALYVQALAAWQKDGNEDRDQDNAEGTSYFQVTGVHGVPYVPWQNDPTAPAKKESDAGYCTHRSVLFIPWHRPYLMLYEQIIHAYAQEIVKNATGYAAKAYGDALGNVRLPYWDWASNPHLPKVIMKPEITLTVPGQKQGTTDTLKLAHNPLYSYRFTSAWATNLMQNEMGWHQTDAWAESKRCPDADGRSNQAVADKQVGTFTQFKEDTFKAITRITDFDQFTTQAWREDQDPHNYNSVEAMHNSIHNYVGSNDSVIKKLQNNIQTWQMGNMTDIQASSFDPVFWLHHVNCDRLTALWQALNPDAVINEWPSLMDRYTANVNNMEGGDSRLEPWHRSSDHSERDYWIANDVKDLISTFDGGYYYPETPVEFLGEPDKMRAYTLKQIYSLYTPQSLRRAPAQNLMKGQGPNFHALVSGLQPGQKQQQRPLDNVPAHLNSGLQQHGQGHDDLIRNQAVSHWQAFLRVRNFALTGTWAVHVFLGTPPADSVDWFLSEERVGSVSMLSNRSRARCANCMSQAEAGQRVTGTVPLTEALQARGLDVNDREAVKQYLKTNLTWKVAKDTEEVPITDELDLTVGVSTQEVTLPDRNDELPTWGHCHVVPEATAGKLGGLDEDNRKSLGV